MRYRRNFIGIVPLLLFLSICLSVFPQPAWGMRVKTGSYVGNGADNRNITGFGFQPDMVMITAAGIQLSVFRSNTVAGDASFTFDDIGGAAVPNQIQALLADGFQVGTHARVNAVKTTYYYVGFKKAAGEFNTGTYTGNGVAGRSITGVGFKPDFIFLRGDDTVDAVGRSSTVSGDMTFKMSSPTVNPGYIQALEPDGFQIGSSAKVNASRTVYHWVAWKIKPNNFNVGSYTGNSVDNRNITGIGFQPQAVFVANSVSGTSRPILRTDFMTGDESYTLADKGLFVDHIQLLQPDGFQVGRGNGVNKNSVLYHWMAWKDESIPVPLVKQVWRQGGTAPLALTNGVPTSTMVPTGTPVIFLIYAKNSQASAMTDVRMQDLLDISATGFSYVLSSLVRTNALAPPADTALDLDIFNATAPGTGTALTDAVDGDVGSICDSRAGACPGITKDRITVGNTIGLVPTQTNNILSIPAKSTFALRFQVIKR